MYTRLKRQAHFGQKRARPSANHEGNLLHRIWSGLSDTVGVCAHPLPPWDFLGLSGGSLREGKEKKRRNKLKKHMPETSKRVGG